MRTASSLTSLGEEARCGEEIFALVRDIFPICRSITGNGVRETLRVLGRQVDLTVHEVPSGTKVFDWTVPPEWNIRDAYIKNEEGARVVDFHASNLHVLGYSEPVQTRLPLEELKEHIFTLPDQPDLIPYRTCYYTRRWGFCMAHRRLEELKSGTYEVLIDAGLDHGSLTYGEHLHAGRTRDEFLLSAHICHPTLANDNCSGVALLTWLIRKLQGMSTRYSYRLLLVPGTIGAITWLARNEATARQIRHGLVVSCVGDAGGPTYKRSRRGTNMIDRAMTHVLHYAGPAARVLDFSPYGYDERQYCSPGFDLPVGLFQRSLYGTFPEYHTSADNLDLVRPEHLAASTRMILAAIDIIENDCRPLSTNPKCEPQLGDRGLYEAIGGDKDGPARSMAMLWVLNLADGAHSLLDMAERAGLPFALVRNTAQLLREHRLLVMPDAIDQPANMDSTGPCPLEGPGSGHSMPGTGHGSTRGKAALGA